MTLIKIKTSEPYTAISENYSFPNNIKMYFRVYTVKVLYPPNILELLVIFGLTSSTKFYLSLFVMSMKYYCNSFIKLL